MLADEAAPALLVREGRVPAEQRLEWVQGRRDEATAWREHAAKLAKRVVEVGQVSEREPAHDQVERAVRRGYLAQVRHRELGLRHVQPGSFHHLRREVHAHHFVAQLHQTPGVAARPARGVECATARQRVDARPDHRLLEGDDRVARLVVAL
jgi:hypothetical protein